MTEKIRREDGFNVAIIHCDGCDTTIQQTREGRGQWFHVDVQPLARDHWNRGDDIFELDFCSTDCFRETVSELDPSGLLQSRTGESS